MRGCSQVPAHTEEVQIEKRYGERSEMEQQKKHLNISQSLLIECLHLHKRANRHVEQEETEMIKYGFMVSENCRFA